MKSLFVSMLLASTATLWLAAPAQAQPHDPGVNARQHHQQQRIVKGVRSGALTPGETRRLGREQRHIRKEERRYKSDGVLTRAERADLHRDQNRASRHIRQQKHDDQRGGWHNDDERRY